MSVLCQGNNNGSARVRASLGKILEFTMCVPLAFLQLMQWQMTL